MKPLLYTLHCGNLFGTERMALATLEGLTEYRRFIFAPISVRAPSLLDVARERHYEVRSFKRIGGLLLALIPVFIRYRRIDMISTSAKHNIICAWLARLLFVRLRQLNVVHGGGEDRYSYANKHRLNKMDIALVAVSRFVRERLLAHGVLDRKIVVIENFLSSSEIASRPVRPSFDALKPGARPLVSTRVRVAVVSRLEPIKRLDVLLAAIAGGRLANFYFDVFGTGELFEALLKRAETQSGHLTFHGYVPDVPLRLPEADLFLHLCPEEPFGLVILEAFAARVPVVVPSSGGAGELVENGLTGMTYAPADAEALASCLLLAAETDGARLDAVAAAAQIALQTRYSARAGVEAYRKALSRT